MKRVYLVSLLLLLFGVWFAGCEGQQSLLVASQEESEYVLPYPVGAAYTCLQGWNGSISHKGVFSYAVDFDLPIGSVVTAARAGVVEYYIDTFPDMFTQMGMENLVIVRHADSTYGRYVHLTTNGSRVRVGQYVVPGDTIGLSGTSGWSYIPHLHFDVTKDCSTRDCQTIPFLFRNTGPHPYGPEKGTKYTAGRR